MDTKLWKVAFLAFPNVTALDLVGPLEVLNRAFENCFVIAENKETIQTSSKLKLLPDLALSECPELNILFVPGGPGQSALMENDTIINFIRQKSSEVQYIAAVCTGTLLLAKAGILQDRRATTHWLARQELAKFNCNYQPKRVVWDENIITGAGVSSGIDVAFEMIDKIIGPDEAKRIQLAIEYDPQPLYNCGSPVNAPAYLIEQLKRTSRFHQQ